jgi:hypothetical protein
MSATAASLTNEEYEERKRMLDEFKKLVKSEQEQIFSILKKHKIEYSENTNGVFFDMSRVSKTAFNDMKNFITFCQANRNEFELRDKALESSRLNLGETNSLE